MFHVIKSLEISVQTDKNGNFNNSISVEYLLNKNLSKIKKPKIIIT